MSYRREVQMFRKAQWIEIYSTHAKSQWVEIFVHRLKTSFWLRSSYASEMTEYQMTEYQVTPPVTPPVTPLVTPLVTPPVTPLVTPPVTPLVTPLVTPPVTPPVTPLVTPPHEKLQEHNGSTSHLELLVMSYGGLVKCVEEHLNPL
jgi:hypothetical protein